MNFTGLTEAIQTITFTDVMKVIASDETKATDKMVYIYLLNALMDLDEHIGRLEEKLNDIQKPNVYED